MDAVVKNNKFSSLLKMDVEGHEIEYWKVRFIAYPITNLSSLLNPFHRGRKKLSFTLKNTDTR
jgi:hypothetical protein